MMENVQMLANRAASNQTLNKMLASLVLILGITLILYQSTSNISLLSTYANVAWSYLSTIF